MFEEMGFVRTFLTCELRKVEMKRIRLQSSTLSEALLRRRARSSGRAGNKAQCVSGLKNTES